jgi:hypothetical protein
MWSAASAGCHQTSWQAIHTCGRYRPLATFGLATPVTFLVAANECGLSTAWLPPRSTR